MLLAQELDFLGGFTLNKARMPWSTIGPEAGHREKELNRVMMGPT